MDPPPRALASRLRDLSRSRGLLAATLLAALAGVALTRLPLFEVPGYELASAMGLLLAGLAAAAGIRAARLERLRILAEGPAVAAHRRVLLPFGAAALLASSALVPPFLAALVGALTSSRCSPWTGIGFYLLLPVPTALLAAAAGTGLGFLFRRAWLAAAAGGLLALAGLALSAWPLWAGPQVFGLDHLVGYFPGPLYDEALAVDSRLVHFRLLTLVWTGLLLTATLLLLDPRAGRLGRPIPTLRRLVLLGLGLAAVGLFHLFAFELGLRTGDADLARTLGGRSETEHFVLHYPRTKPLDEVRRLERDLEYGWAHLHAFLGVAPQGKVTAWFHRSADEKRRLVGAAHTDYAKPWRAEFHVADRPFPHRTARHELAHVFGAAFGSPLFGVSARWLVSINIGLVEGLAVAAEHRTDELTLHEWAAAMRRLKLAPDIRLILDPVGFYGQPPSRAYTLAGSFLGFVAERHGAAALRRLYPAGEFREATGKGLEELAGEWEAFLDAMPLGERALHTAEVRFERGSLFARPCAREVALLSREAAELSGADPERALTLYRRCQQIEPGNPHHLRGEAEVLQARRDLDGALGLWRRLLAEAGEGVGARTPALMAIGDLAWEKGDVAAARDSFEKVLGLHRDEGTDRAAWVKLESLEDPEAGPVLRRFFANGAGFAELLQIEELADRRPGWATGPYLVGRQLLGRDAPGDALPHFERARALGLGSRELAVENLRLLARAAYLAGDFDRARRGWRELAAAGDPADQALAADWIARCDFEQAAYGGPLPPAP